MCELVVNPSRCAIYDFALHIEDTPRSIQAFASDEACRSMKRRSSSKKSRSAAVKESDVYSYGGGYFGDDGAGA